MTGGFNTATLAILRAQQGTSVASHAAGAAVTLEPYYRRYLPCRSLDFAPLNLPAF